MKCSASFSVKLNIVLLLIVGSLQQASTYCRTQSSSYLTRLLLSLRQGWLVVEAAIATSIVRGDKIYPNSNPLDEFLLLGWVLSRRGFSIKYKI